MAWTPSGLRPLVKWTGGKSDELEEIHRRLPERIDHYFEPFIGGGAVWMSLPSSVPAVVNDACADLVSLYRYLRNRDDGFLAAVETIEAAWRVPSLELLAGCRGAPEQAIAQALVWIEASAGFVWPTIPGEFAREARRYFARKAGYIASEGGPQSEKSLKLGVSALKAALYTALRSAYNASQEGPERAALWWFLRDFCYGGMFRQNASGGMNVPYGGLSYDRRSMAGRLAQAMDDAVQSRLATTVFCQGDFAQMLDGYAPKPDDFVFLDPPYDSRFRDYAGNAFGREDHLRLADWMVAARCRWMMVIADTPFVREAYSHLPGVRTESFPKRYRGGIKGRYDQTAVHLVFMNYTPGTEVS